MGVFDVLLNALDVDAAIVTDPADMTYLSGYDNADCVIVVTRDRAVYFTDARYTEEAARIVGEKLKVVDGRLAPDALQTIVDSGAKRVAFDSRLDFASYRLIAACASENAFELVPCDGVAAKLRIVKSRAEIDAIERAQEITDNAFEEILPLIREGIAEYELAAKLEYAILSKGAKLAFDSIVAFGENGSSPHAHRSDRRLKRGDFVTMDFGAKWQGYCSDMTRTLAFGSISGRRAQMRIKACSPPMSRALPPLRLALRAETSTQRYANCSQKTGLTSSLSTRSGMGSASISTNCPICRRDRSLRCNAETSSRSSRACTSKDRSASASRTWSSSRKAAAST